MILVLHITIALASIIYTSMTYISPTKGKVQTSSGLAALTLLTGTVLVISTHSALLQACATGVTYLAIVSAGIIAADRKLKRSH